MLMRQNRRCLESETNKSPSGQLNAVRGGAPLSQGQERRYQDCTFAQRYQAAYTGSFPLRTLAAWIIAALERYHVARALRECRPPPAVLLDVPCGTGKLAKVLGALETQVVGADLSMAMMECARGAYRTSRFSGFVRSSVEQLPFDTGAFDTVVCLRLMHLFSPASRQNALKELARVASRRVIVSFGMVGSFQLLRLKIRRAIFRNISTPYPVRFADLPIEIDAAGLYIARWRRILPIFSCEYLLTLEKVGIDPSLKSWAQPWSAHPRGSEPLAKLPLEMDDQLQH
jgi:ubiquinone/menaquinone biosynthesis C-methylase UbiE